LSVLSMYVIARLPCAAPLAASVLLFSIVPQTRAGGNAGFGSENLST
jgi:hypothetical protein